MSSARRLLRAVVLAGVALGVALPSSAAHAEPSLTEIQRRITAESARLERVVEQYNGVNEQLNETRARAATAAARLAPLQAQVDGALAEVGDIAVTAYKQGRLGAVGAVLTAGSGSAFVEQVTTLDRITRDRQAKIAAYAATRQRYADEQRTLDALVSRQAAQARELAAAKVRIEADLKKLFQMRRAAYGSETTAGSRYTGRIPAVSGKAGIAVRYAYGAIGTPYRWGGESASGYDCSGLVKAAWRAAGVSLPHNAAMQWRSVAHISRRMLRGGDLVFYHGLGHVAIYVGAGKVIHAPTFGESVVLRSVDMTPPYGYGRVRS